MEIRFVVAAAAAALSVVIGSAPAQAGLAGSTVTANSWFGGTNSPPGVCDPQTNATCNLMDYNTPGGPTNSPLPIVPVTYPDDFLTLTTTSISDTTITIVNNSALPFCTTNLPCADVFDGFAFTFSGAPAISSVTVDPGSSADFLPVSLASNATAIYVNLAGDSPAVNSTLILDVTTGSFSFTRTVSGNWTDTTGWTPNGVPNGATVTAQLVNPATGTNNVNLGGGTFTVNQLQFSGTNAGTWNVTNGTIVFDGTNPTFLNQGDSSGLAGSLPNLTLNATTTFEIDNASAKTDVTGDITGAGGLIKTGAGTLTLTGTNTYSGGTTISTGTLQIGNGGTTGSIVGNVTDNSALAFDRSNNVTFGGVVSGTGSLTQLGAGTLTLTGANTYAGGTTISAGTLQIGAGGTAGSIVGNVLDNSALAFDRSDNVTFGGVISGTGSLTQLGAGTLTLTGANTYAGGTTISAGTLQIGAGGTSGSIVGNVLDNSALAFDRSDNVTFGGVISGSGSLAQLGGGTLTLTGANTYTGGTTISAGTLQIGAGGTAGSIVGNVLDNSALAFDRSDNVTFGGVISGTGSLTQLGAGTLTLTGANTYTGGTTISAGTLQIGAGGTAGSIVGNVLDNSALAFDRSNNVTFGGVISGTGSLTQLGAGTLTLTGANTYAGGTTISAGTLQIGAGGTAGSIVGNVLDNSALAFDRSNNVTFGGVISGTGSLTQLGAGTLTLTGTSTYSGGTTISAGTLQIGAGGTAGSIVGNVLDNSALAFDRSDNVTFGGVISGTGSLTQLGAGTLTLTGTNTYSGGTTISAGTLQIGAGGTAGSIVGNVLDNSALAFDRSDNVTFGGVISGTGSLTQLGAGTLTLTGTNTYSGGTTISAGTLQIGAGGTAGSIVGNVLDNSALAFDRSDNVTFGGVISGTGSLTQLGLGTLTLTGANTYTGGTTISAGTLALSGAGSIAGSSGVADNSAFDISGTTAGASITTLSGSGTVALGAQTLTLTNQSSTFAGVIGGSGGLTLTGAGTETLTGANTYSGGTTIAAGTLQIGAGGTSGSIVGNVADNSALAFDRSDNMTFGGVISGSGSLAQLGGGTLTLTGANTYTGGTTISAGALQLGAGGTSGSIVGNVADNGVLAFDRSDSVTFGGVISGTGSVLQAGAGATILTVANTYTGGTTISAGTLQLGNGGTSGSIVGNVADNGVLAFDRSDSVTFGGVISGTGSVLQAGAGATILTVANTYTGGTTISAGTLQLGNGGTSGSIVGNVADNGALAFDRSDSITFGSVISGSGSLAQLGGGTLTLTGANTYTGGTAISAGTLQIGGAGSLGGGSYGGAITDDGTLQYSSSGGQTLSGVISGAGALTKDSSTSTLTLTGANTYSGGTTISAGTLQIGAGGTAGSIVGNVLDNSALAFDRSNNVTFGGVISGTGSLTQLGLGTLTLTGANTYTGGTTISAGALALSGAGSIAGSSGVADNSAFDISGTTAGASITTLSGSGTVALGAQTLTLTNQSSTFAGVIGGSGGLTLTGAGTETLTGANTYTGGTTISAGTLQIGGAGSLGGGSYAGAIADDGTLQYSSSASQTLSGVISGAGALTKDTNTSTLTLTSANTYSGGTTISAGTLQIGNGGTTGSIVGNVTDNSALAFDRSDNVTFGGVISGTGSLTQLGLGTLTLTGANTYTGGTTISAGTLALSGAGSIAGSSGVADNSAFDISGTTAGASITTLSGSGTVALGAQTLTLTNQSSTFAGVIGGSGGLTLTGAGTETLTGANTYSGGTTIAAGTLQIGAGGTSGSIVGNVADNSALAFDRSDNMTFGGVISGSGSLAQLGGGTLTLTGANTYTGGTTISAGALQLGAGGTSGSIVGNVADNGVLAFDRSDTVTFGGVISGTGSVLQAGAGATILTVANTYTGGTTISAGTLQLGNGGTSGSIVGNVADNGVLAFDRSDSVTFGGVISGTGSVLQAGAGATILTVANTYTGGTTISAGTLQLGNGGTSGSIVGNVADNGALAFDRSDSVTFGSVISGTGSVLQEGAGATILTSANSYSGGTTVVNGTLGVGANGALGTGPVELFADATLAFTANGLNLANAVVLEGSLDPTIDTGANTDTISGVISGPGALTKTGSGALILTGADTYSGATTVAAGTLIVNGSIAASSSLTLESGATLGGTGTVGGLVATSGATIAPGVLAPFSALTVNGAASFAAGSIFAVNVNAAGQNDKLVTTGATTISGGTVQVTAAPGTYAPQTRYTLITAGGGVSGTFSALTGLSSLAFLSPALSYDADDVYLGFSVKTAPSSTPLFASIAQTPNQSAIALALQAQPPGSPLYDAIIGQTVAGAVAAFDALSGEIHASAVSAAFDDQRLPREAVFDRLATPYGGAVAGGAQSVQTLAAPNPAQVFAAWGQAFDSWGHIGGDGNAATLSNNLGGLIFGADATLQGRYRLGVAGGYDYSTLGLGARSSSGNVSTTYVGLYGGLSDGALQLRGGGFYGYNHYGTSRTAVFPGFADTLGSGYGGDTWQAFAEAGWRMPVGGLAAYSAWAEPFAGLTGLEIATRSFGESAGAAALNGASATYDYGITTLGLRGEVSLFAWAPLVANGMIGWQRAFGDVTPNSVLAFASAPSVPFAIAGAPIARNALAVEAGADWRFTANVKLGIYYSGLIASNASDNAIKVKLEANF